MDPTTTDNQASSGNAAALGPLALLGGWHAAVALLAVLAIGVHLVLWWNGFDDSWWGLTLHDWPLIVALVLGGGPLVFELLRDLLRGVFGSDLLAAISIATSWLLEEYLAGVIVVLMLAGGQWLERFAARRAASVLEALASRMPSQVHLIGADGRQQQVAAAQVRVGDLLLVHPHEVCPVDGKVAAGIGEMDESYLSGEPFLVPKSPGSKVLSGSINGGSLLKIQATSAAEDSRYAQIMQVMQASAQRRPRMRRLADQLGAWYTPLALSVAIAAWLISGEAIRFLAVLVVATPCPLLIGIPITIIGSISLAARRGIIIKNPAILERLDSLTTAIFDKTGTLTYGRPLLVEQVPLPEGCFDSQPLLGWSASLQRYSKHPLGQALLRAAEKEYLPLSQPTAVREEPGHGIQGEVDGHQLWITSREQLMRQHPEQAQRLPPTAGGLECVLVVDAVPERLYRFRDTPRRRGRQFISHLRANHRIGRAMIVSGDRLEEVQYLAELMDIEEIHAQQSPEQKVEIVRREVERGTTLFVGDGINDAPALATASIGVAFGSAEHIASQAADAVVLDSSLERLDELLHIGRRMRRIALQSAVGGMLLSIGGMGIAAAGYLPPVAGAVFQEVIDVLAVLNALRAAQPPSPLSDLEPAAGE